jgi:DNA polymerase-1
VLGAVYGQTSGDGLKNLAALRRRFPKAVAYVDDAARAGEEGRLVRTWLGRTCPPAAGVGLGEEAGIPQERSASCGPGEPGDQGWVPGYASTNSRARGRFARNFVVQGSAADWTLLVLAALRRTCRDMAAELVFFQHDEVIVHCPEEEAETGGRGDPGGGGAGGAADVRGDAGAVSVHDGGGGVRGREVGGRREREDAK